MFGFLNSIVLPALAGAAVPLIIHFFYKRRTKTVLFSSIRFLKLLESKRIKHLRIYQLLLVLIRMLFILALVAAFARPVIRSNFFSDASANTTAVILLDDSYSMQALTSSSDYFQEAKESLKTILKLFSKKDKVFLLLPSQSEPLADISPKRIQELRPTFGKADFSSAFKHAFRIFKKHNNYNREFYIISDFRINKQLLPDSLEALLAAAKTRLFLLNPAQNLAFKNSGIDTVIVNSQIIEQNKPFSLSAHLHNYNLKEEQETRIHLFSGQKRLAMKTVLLPPGANLNVSFSVLPKQAGTLPLHFELNGDDLFSDNFYYFNVSVAGKRTLLFVGDLLPKPLFAALKTLSEQSQLHIKTLPFKRLKGTDLNGFDAVLLLDPPLLEKAVLYRLKQFRAAGHSLIIVPGARTNNGALNELMSFLTGKRPFLPLKTISPQDGYFATDERFESDGLFRPLFGARRVKIPAPEIYRFYPLHPEGHSLIRLKNGRPLLTSFYENTASGKVYVFASALDLKWNNLPLQGFFVPLLHRLFYLAAQAEGTALSTRADENLYLYLPGVHPQERYELKTPAAESLPLNPSPQDNGVSLFIKAPLAPGQYRILQKGRALRLFSVNLSADELRGPYYSFKTSRAHIYSLQKGPNLTKQITQNRGGYALWPFFAGIAFLLLLLEIILIKQIEGKSERTSD